MGVGDPRDFLWGEACAMIERAERLHRQFFQPGFSANQAASWEPPVDIFETEGKLWIIAALPGVAPEAVQVEIEGPTVSSRKISTYRSTGMCCAWLDCGGCRRKLAARRSAGWKFPTAASSAASGSRRLGSSSTDPSSRAGAL